MTHSDASSTRISDDEAPDARLPEEGRSDPAAANRSGFSFGLADEVRALLTTRVLGRVMRAYDEVGSTNTLAAEWIAEGAPHGAVVVADHQTRGRGRLGRSWSARAGLNLTFSVVVRPEMPSDRLGMLTVAACTSVARTIDRFADPLQASIKWPNDIILGGGKLCGMLLEASWNSSAEKPAVVLGIGLNVNQDEFPEAIRESATSLLVETGRVIQRAEIFTALLTDLEHEFARLEADEEQVRRDYMKRMLSLGEEICLRFAAGGQKVEGVVVGIDKSGGIILDTRSGRRVCHAGEVTRAV